MMVLVLMMFFLTSHSQTDLVATFKSTTTTGFDNFGEWEKEELLISFSDNKIKFWLNKPITIFLKDLVEKKEGEEYIYVYEAVDNAGDSCLIIMSFSEKDLILYILYGEFSIKYYIPYGD